ncbi:hypothetical protein BXY66_2286 [Shimia isoporae]|uniref:Uncharacterized protein n=1 Tax=Shimia isoporae TaxID=647720 RepID=A0A4R1NP34_9RHOB|nr:hypothetical protein [Shimia isoporae]TCL10217.1 hypothetical protein BXY66_2286 [Shimia isoporae]
MGTGFTVYEATTLLVISFAHIGAMHVYRRQPDLSRWLLDFSSGLGIGYAFLYLLPKIGTMTIALQTSLPANNVLMQYQLYFYLLGGFLVYYLVDFKRHEARPSHIGEALNLASFMAYSALIGATVVHLNSDIRGVYLTSAVVFTLHLFGVNNFLFRMYPEDFGRWMRWAFVVALMAGGYAGTQVEKYNPYQSVATAVVGGVIIILSVRLKLPARARVNTKAFLLGVATAVFAVVVYVRTDTY